MKKMVVASLVGALLLGGAASSHADPVCSIKSFNGMSIGVVMHPGRSGEFDELMKAGMKEAAVRCCVRCIPRVGTKVSVTDAGDDSHTIRVLEGTHKDCVGEIIAGSLDC
jgi:hypothetical protein